MNSEQIKLRNLNIFEKSILNYDPNNPSYYILSSNYNKEVDPMGTLLSKISIFDNVERGTIKRDKKLIKQVLEILMTNNDPQIKKKELEIFKLDIKEKRAIGSMLGMAIGDAMGARYEFQKVRYGKQDLFNMGEIGISNFNMEPGQWTDDTSMGLCLADSLLMNNGKLNHHDLMRRFLCWWNGGYNNAFRFNTTPRHSVGLGGNISKSFIRYRKYQEPKTGAGDENTSGNGSIMRNAAIPICFHHNDNLACENAREQSLVTHKGLEAKECCGLLTHIIVELINRKEDENEKLKDILFNLTSSYHTTNKGVECLSKSLIENNDINRNWNWKVPQYKYSPERALRLPDVRSAPRSRSRTLPYTDDIWS